MLVRRGVFVFGSWALALFATAIGCSPDETGPGAGELTGDHSRAGSPATGGTSGGSRWTGGTAGAPTPTGGAAGKSTGANGGSNVGSGGQTAAGGADGGGVANDAGEPGSGAGGSTGAAAGSGGGDRPGWRLVFADEFEGEHGTPVNSEHWNLVNRGDGFGNDELQFYTDRAENASLDGKGSLAITAIEEAYRNRDYTSARLESNGKVEVTYGRIEGRIKLPFGQGIWPAFWMLGNDIGSVSWPQCGEIDVMENIGREPTIAHGTLHGPGYSGSNPLGASYSLPDGAPFSDDFQVFAVEWEENVVRFYVNDDLYETRTPADLPNGAEWVFDHPFYLLLNVAVGGTWPGAPDDTTTFPQTMLVDYVRVYAR